MNIIKHCRTLSLLSLNKKWRLCFKSGSHNYCVRLLAAEAGDLRYLICKYCTGSKKVLQNKNRFQRMEKPFLMVFPWLFITFLIIQGFFAFQKDYIWSARKPFLHCKTTTVVLQKWSLCNEMYGFFALARCIFRAKML